MSQLLWTVWAGLGWVAWGMGCWLAARAARDTREARRMLQESTLAERNAIADHKQAAALYRDVQAVAAEFTGGATE